MLHNQFQLKARDMDDILQLPRKPSQRWVFITDESPQNTNLFKDKLNGKLVRAECVRQRNEVAIIQGIIFLLSLSLSGLGFGL